MRGKLMRLLTREQHIAILAKHPNNVDAAAAYTERLGVAITRQNVRYWRTLFHVNEGNLAKTDRELIQRRVLRTPQPDDDIGDLSFIPEVAHSILVIGDIHAPYQHPDMFEFIDSVAREIEPDLVIQIGDEVDGHAISFHDSDPNLDSAGVELEKSKKVLDKLHARFPQMLICHSNHGSLVYRRAKASGLPVQMIRKYREILFPHHEAPGWSWGFEWTIQTPTGPVLFKHQSSGPVLSDAAHCGASLVVGHEHSKFAVEYGASPHRLYFGAYTGCLVHRDSLAFAYGKNISKKPIIGLLVIIGGVPTLVPMVLDEDGRWIHRSL